MVFRILLATALASSLLASGSVASPKSVSLGPLVRAFKTRVPDLEAAADAGDHEAQFALALLYEHGLRGVTRDLVAAQNRRKAALVPPPGRQITQYIPGINGQPGRVSMIYLPQSNPVSSAASQVDRCVAVLEKTASARASFFPNFKELEAKAADPSIEQREDKDAAACGGPSRYAALASLWNLAKPWGDRPLPSCDPGDNRCLVLRTKVQHLNARNPSTEAAAAAARGDFALGAFNHIGPSPRGWDTPGISCSVWTRDLIGKWHVNQDAVRGGDSEHTNASLAFMAAYNRALVNDPAFPYADICSETAVAPAARYAGPVKSFPEAARSGEESALATAAGLGADVNGHDPFGMTALAWAASRNDQAIERALLEREADPNLHREDEPSPLALALNRKQLELAGLMLAKGARMTGQTGLCQAEGGFVFLDAEAKPLNRTCTWAGLLIATGQFDLLDQQAAAGALERPYQRESLTDMYESLDSLGERSNPVVAIDEGGELRAAFFDAVARKDDPVVRRLLPHVGHGRVEAVGVIDQLYKTGRRDLVGAYVLGHGGTAARSEAEAELWRAAAQARQDEALAFLHDFGADLNLLTRARFAECRTAAVAGAVDRLLACVREAKDRREAVPAALAARDIARFDALAAEAVDVRERFKPTLVELAAQTVPASSLRPLLARGAAAGTYMFTTESKAAYSGRLKAEAEALTAFNPASPKILPAPILSAAKRGDAESLRLLVDAGAPNLLGSLSTVGNLGNRAPGLSNSFDTDLDDDSERYPNSPGPEALRAIDLLAGEIARVYGPASLGPAFGGAVFSGYNDVLDVLLRRGFDPRKVKHPERIWSNVSGFDEPCKPSTIRILLRSGLPTSYPSSEYTRWPPLHGISPRCRNPRSAAALAPTVGVNSLSSDGETALDVARQYRQTKFAAALRALGGKTAKEVNPAMVVRREQKARTTDDLDLVQSEAK